MQNTTTARELAGAFRALCTAQAVLAGLLIKFTEPAAKRDTPYSSDDVGALLSMSRHKARALLSQAQAVTARPAVFNALLEGKIDLGKALLIVGKVQLLPASQADIAEAKLLEYAPTRTYVSLRKWASQLVCKLDPAGTERRHAEKRRRRMVEKTNADDGMCSLHVRLTAVDGLLAWGRIDRLAKSLAIPGDRRTLDQRRADVTRDLLVGEAVHASLRQAKVQVTVPITTLIGINDDPGVLAGYGPVPASVAKEIAAGGTWKRILTDPATGIALDVGRTEYEPSEALREFVKARDGICSAIGCDQAAENCTVDHCTPASDTTASAMDFRSLCQHHQRMRHESGWTCHHMDDGRHFWITPSGGFYESESEPIADPSPTENLDGGNPGPRAPGAADA
ncbi:HNH endonuclease signature motif containing protein [Allokutzneria multivorans]|uniref:HNH endonuclease signature motif containing protein n=1 Tax=Allokutzneria multivorans TaxID=1142134 RepID=A0ABP7TTC3_9PSEU